MAESVELPSRLAILPFRNKVLLPGAIIRIRCTSPSSVKLVEQELWQREEKGLIGILPVRDAAAAAASSDTLYVLEVIPAREARKLKPVPHRIM
uniref:Lon N-terminal domain-containing protein n=1 Tax=Salix viminalis TaxID=40686 RepID=A0A6N2MZ48_SALVM